MTTKHSYSDVIVALKKQTELQAAIQMFMVKYEGPGIPNGNDRQRHASLALDAHGAAVKLAH